ncbi:MAG TPA: hypothetical protein VG476_02680 [Acidimicrobiales bacterium]|nr:hypothetical protein [Acidimicrobiales bacterium]
MGTVVWAGLPGDPSDVPDRLQALPFVPLDDDGEPSPFMEYANCWWATDGVLCVVFREGGPAVAHVVQWLKEEA